MNCRDKCSDGIAKPPETRLDGEWATLRCAAGVLSCSGWLVVAERDEIGGLARRAAIGFVNGGSFVLWAVVAGNSVRAAEGRPVTGSDWVLVVPTVPSYKYSWVVLHNAARSNLEVTN